MPYSFHFNWMNHRWVLGSADICFHKFLHRPVFNAFLAWFFAAGKTIPVTHGTGVYQDGTDFALERLKRNEWVNLYPEGQVNKDHTWRRLYWGIGRLVYDSFPKVPTVLPFYHIGLDKVYPPVGPNKYTFQRNNPITVLIGEPLDLTEFVEKLKNECCDDLDGIERVTKHLQDILFDMRIECEKLHLEHLKEKRPEHVDTFLTELVPRVEPPREKSENFHKIYTQSWYTQFTILQVVGYNNVYFSFFLEIGSKCRWVPCIAHAKWWYVFACYALYFHERDFRIFYTARETGPFFPLLYFPSSKIVV